MTEWERVTPQASLVPEETVCPPPMLSALPTVSAVPQLSPRVVDENPPWEEVFDDECTVLWEVLLKEPLLTACEVPPPSELDWLEKVPED